MTPHPDAPSDLVAALEAHAGEPWADAWMQALASRGGMPFFPEQEAEVATCLARGFVPRVRNGAEIAGRAAIATHLAGMADRMGAPGEEDRFQRALRGFMDIGAPGPALEHIELAFLQALQDGDPRGEGAAITLTWRGHAAAALVWVLQGFDDLEDASEAEPDLVERWYGIDLREPRPLAAIRAALDATSRELDSLERGTRRHSVLLERKKALRWATEPWWPELALTPWRTTDRLDPKSPEQFEAARANVELRRSADDILHMAVTFFIHGSLTANLRRHGLPVFHGMGLCEKSGLLPRALEVREFWERTKDGEQTAPDVLMRMVWLSAGADALFWAAGKLDAIPEGDPPDDAYQDLLEAIQSGRTRAWLQTGTRRDDSEIASELSRQIDQVKGNPMGSEAHSFALQRVRALRWVVDYGFADPTVTPWDGGDEVRPFDVAPVPMSPELMMEAMEGLLGVTGDEPEPEPEPASRSLAPALAVGAVVVVLVVGAVLLLT